MIDVGDFKPVTLRQKSLFKDHYARYPQSHSENLFTTLVSWANHTPAYYLLRGDALMIMRRKDGRPQFHPPIGEKDDSVLTELFEVARSEGGPQPVVAIDEAAKNWIRGVYADIKPTPDEDFFDYVYLAGDLAELPGKPYIKQRSHLNRFRRQYRYSVEQVSAKNVGEADGFINRWCRKHGCEKDPLLDAEVKALLYCMSHFIELELSGIVLRMGGEMQALSIYEPINESTVAIHFEKAMPGYDGIYPAINNEAAKLIAKRYAYINRESDLGIEGLRTAKQRLHPHHMERIYYITKEELSKSDAGSKAKNRQSLSD